MAAVRLNPSRSLASFRIASASSESRKLAGFFFYGHENKSPPYPLTEVEAQALFGADFVRVVDEPVRDSLPLFAGRERWQVLEKNVAAR